MSKDVAKTLLSDVVVYQKYSKIKQDTDGVRHRSTWKDLVDDYCTMMKEHYPQLSDEIERGRPFIEDKKVLPSMRAIQFSGLPIERNNARMYNCSGLAICDDKAFSELMFLLISGAGVGISVERHQVEQLPTIKQPAAARKFYISDTIEGWADAVRMLVYAYTRGQNYPKFDYSDIRPKGALVKKLQCAAPGSEGLQQTIKNMDSVFRRAVGRKLRPIEVFDICCHIADGVVAGDIRSSALITFFDMDDREMLDAKRTFNIDQVILVENTEKTKTYEITINGQQHTLTLPIDNTYAIEQLEQQHQVDWYYLFPQRARSNNSVRLVRGEVDYDDFSAIIHRALSNGTGEPGFVWMSDRDTIANPCCEISFKSESFCNLSTINCTTVTDQKDFDERAHWASFFGTLQAGFTDFHYLRYSWKENAEQQALIGVSLTGLASDNVRNIDFRQGARQVVETNEETANKIGIRPADRCTCIKPEGTTSLVVGSCGSGIHSAFGEYYIRRIRIAKSKPLAQFLQEHCPRLMENDTFDSSKVILSVPVSAVGYITEQEGELGLLERIRQISDEWIATGHRNGANHNNCSATVMISPENEQAVIDWMFENRDSYTGLSVLPKFDSTYPQLPFEKISKETYDELIQHVPDGLNVWDCPVDVFTEASKEIACSGGACEIRSL